MAGRKVTRRAFVQTSAAAAAGVAAGMAASKVSAADKAKINATLVALETAQIVADS